MKTQIDEAKIKLYALMLAAGMDESISDSDLILFDLLSRDKAIQDRLNKAAKHKLDI